MIASLFSFRYLLDWLRGEDAERLQLMRLMQRRAEIDREVRRLRGFLPACAAYIEYTERGTIVAQLERTVPVDALIAIAHLSHEDPELLDALHDVDLLRHAASLQQIYDSLSND